GMVTDRPTVAEPRAFKIFGHPENPDHRAVRKPPPAPQPDQRLANRGVEGSFPKRMVRCSCIPTTALDGNLQIVADILELEVQLKQIRHVAGQGVERRQDCSEVPVRTAYTPE